MKKPPARFLRPVKAAQAWQGLCETGSMKPERMLPLQQLPDAALRPLRGVLTDIDDTLTRDGAIEPAALQALHQLARADLRVVAITGRPAGWSEPFAMDWPVAAIVAENGAVMLRRVGARLQRDFTQDEATRARNLASLQQCASAVLAALPQARLARDSGGRLTDIAIDHSEFERLDDADIDTVRALMHAHGLRASVSSIHVNGWIGEHDKWSGARWAVERALGLDFDPAQWLYVGDSTNDQLMFEHLPLSVAVANIRRFLPQLTVLPAYVTPSERGQGFAEVVQHLLQGRQRR
jgi:HAD superfamily hydrolase (TIGR01484 family)